MNRTFKQLTSESLNEIRDYALAELEDFLYSNDNKYAVYEENLIAICLCQGGAQHYIDGFNINKFDNEVIVKEDEILELNDKMQGVQIESGLLRCGIHDVDVWMFFKEDNLVKIPSRRNYRTTSLLTLSGIGSVSFDFMKKVITEKVITKSLSSDIREIVKSYLNNANTDTSRFLRQKSVIGLYPKAIFAEHIWKVKRTF